MSGINGLTFFHPNRVAADTTRYHTFITDFKVHNRSLVVGSPELPQDINYTDRITLRHQDNQISFSFSALSFIAQDNLQYGYMLEGIDTEWIYAGSEPRYVSYGNLPTGNLSAPHAQHQYRRHLAGRSACARNLHPSAGDVGLVYPVSLCTAAGTHCLDERKGLARAGKNCARRKSWTSCG